MPTKPKWREFEDLVASIQSELAPAAIVTPNDKIRGKSGAWRQIDVSVRQRVGQYDFLAVLDAKDYKKRVDIKRVDEFIGLVKDVGAHKGAIVSALGFSPNAVSRATEAGIELYRPVATGSRMWTATVTIPATCDLRKLARFALEFSSSSVPRIPPIDPRLIELYGPDGCSQGLVINLLASAWNRLPELPEPGELRLRLGHPPTFIRVDAGLFALEVHTSVIVERRIYFGHLPVADLQGFEDQRNGGVIMRSLKTDFVDFADIERSWAPIESVEQLAVRPIFRMEIMDHLPETVVPKE